MTDKILDILLKPLTYIAVSFSDCLFSGAIFVPRLNFIEQIGENRPSHPRLWKETEQSCPRG